MLWLPPFLPTLVIENTLGNDDLTKFSCRADAFPQYCSFQLEFPHLLNRKFQMSRSTRWWLSFASLICGCFFAQHSAAQDEITIGKPTLVVASTEPASAAVTADERLQNIFSGVDIPKTVDDLRAMQEQFSRIAERVKLATVGVDCGGAQGSGVVISRDGLVLTAAHVIGEPGKDATIRLADGTTVEAKTKGLFHSKDSGLIKIVVPGNYNYLDMGESGTLNLGTWVMAVGHPGGYEATRGMVVRVGRVLTLTSRVIRTDCTLVGGDSGGPLVDMNGNVVGIHSRIGARLSDNMHVPIDAFADDWDDLESGKEIGAPPPSPSLGLRLKEGDGLEIESIRPDGPADNAEIMPGDVILEINGEAIKTRNQLSEQLNKLEIGNEVEIKVLRAEKELILKLVVGRQ